MVLWVLKIIGILLLMILLIVLGLVVTVVITPIQYKANAQASGTLESIEADICISWLLHLVSARFCLKEQEWKWKIRIFWKLFSDDQEDAADDFEDEEIDDILKEIREQVDVSRTNAENAIRDVEKTILDTSNPKGKLKRKKGKEEKKKPRKKIDILDKIKDTLQKIFDIIRKIKMFIYDETHQFALKTLKKEVYRLLRVLKPKTFIANVHFGLEDPSNTGKVLAGLSILYPFYGEHIDIVPDFEREIYEGNVVIKGKIQILYGIGFMLNLIRDKYIRMTYKDIQKIKGGMQHGK